MYNYVFINKMVKTFKSCKTVQDYNEFKRKFCQEDELLSIVTISVDPDEMEEDWYPDDYGYRLFVLDENKNSIRLLEAKIFSDCEDDCIKEEWMIDASIYGNGEFSCLKPLGNAVAEIQLKEE